MFQLKRYLPAWWALGWMSLLPPLVRPRHQVAVLTLGVDQVGIERIDAADKAVAAVDEQVVRVAGSARSQGLRRSAPTAVVLEAAVDAIGPAIVDADVVELPQGEVVEVLPVGGTIVGRCRSRRGADDHVPAILGIDPQVVMIGVQAGVDPLGIEGLAAVGAALEVDAERVDDLFVGGIDGTTEK